MIADSLFDVCMQIVVTLVPLRDQNGRFGEAYMTCCCNLARDYFPATVITEEEAAFSRDKTYVVGEHAACAAQYVGCVIPAVPGYGQARMRVCRTRASQLISSSRLA